jgi:hypothetical protein
MLVMTPEMCGDNGEANSAELQLVSQESLGLLLEMVRERCPSHFIETIGNGGISWEGTQEGKQLHVDLDYYGDKQGPTRYDTDGSMGTDTTGRYKHSHDSFYYDTGVQATIFKTEKAEESQANGKKLFTSYTVINNGQQLEIDKRVQPFQLPIFLRLGDQLVPKKDNPPLITTPEHQVSAQQEDALGLSTVSEREAKDLIGLLSTI